MKDKLEERIRKYIESKEHLIEIAEQYGRRDKRGPSSDFQNRIDLLREINPDVDLGLCSEKITGIDIIDKLLLIDKHVEALLSAKKILDLDYRNTRAYTRTFRDFIRSRYLSKELYEFIINISLGDFLKEVDNGTLCDRVYFWECGMSYEEEVIRKKRPWSDIAEDLHFSQRRFNSAGGHYNPYYIESLAAV